MKACNRGAGASSWLNGVPPTVPRNNKTFSADASVVNLAGFMAAVTLLLVLQALLLAPLAGALDNSLGKTPPCVTNAALAEPDR